MLLFVNVNVLMTFQKWKVLGAVVGGVGTLIGALEYSIWASGNEAKPFKHPWSHNGPISSFDHAR